MRTDASSGLSLIELVVTISLAAIIGIPIGILLSEELNGALRARDVGVAMSLARYEMERLDGLNDFCASPDLDLTAPTGVTVLSPSYPQYVVTRIVSCQTGNCASNCGTPSDANNGVKRIDIRVTKSGSTDLLASLVSYRTKFVLLGS